MLGHAKIQKQESDTFAHPHHLFHPLHVCRCLCSDRWQALWREHHQSLGRRYSLWLGTRRWWDQAFFVIRGEGGGEILEEAGTFSGQALLLSYPYPRGGGVQSRRQAPTHRLVHSTYPPLVHAAQGWNRYFTLNLVPHKISTWPNLLWLAP